jgi:hypothetical protein
MLKPVLENCLELCAVLTTVYRWRGEVEHQYFLGGVAVACGKQRARTPTRPPQIGYTFIVLPILSANLFQV